MSLKNFYVTFGQRYRQEHHPFMANAHPDGWLRIEAETNAEARETAFDWLDVHWAFVYDEKDFDKSLFPLGELKHLTVKPKRLTIHIIGGQLWKHRKTGKVVVIEAVSMTSIMIKHESGRITNRQNYRFRYDYEPLEGAFDVLNTDLNKPKQPPQA